MKSIISLTLMTLFLFASSVLSGAEVTDHPVVEPLPGSTLDPDEYEYSDQVAYTFKYIKDGKMVEKKVTGKYWMLEYEFLGADGKRDESVTGPDIIKKYRNAAKKQRAQLLGEDNRNLLFVLASGGEKYWVHVKAGSWKGWYRLNIIQEEETDSAAASELSAGGDSSDKSFASLTAEAVKHNRAGRKVEAVSALRDAIFTIWDEVPLEVRNVRLIEDPEDYTEKKDNIFSQNEPIYITSQIYGHSMRREGDSYRINIYTDFMVLTLEGEILAGQENAFRFDNISPFPKYDFSLDLTYRPGGLPPGFYRIVTTVHDRNSGESADFENVIEIR